MSALETLLEAARFIELQEQRGSSIGLSSSSPPPPPITSTLGVGGVIASNITSTNGIRFQQQQQHQYYENSPSNGIIINARNNSNTTRQQQHLQNNHLNNHQVVVTSTSSPPLRSSGLILTNNSSTTSNGPAATTTNIVPHQQQQQHRHIITANNNNHEFSLNDYTVLVPNGRSIDGRIVEQPFFNHNNNNGHTNSQDSTTNHINHTTINNTLNGNSATTTTTTTTTPIQHQQQQYNKNVTKNNFLNNNMNNNNHKLNSYNHHVTNNNNNIIKNNKNNTSTHMKFVPLTPPPMSSRKLVESTRIRSISLSSNKITANGVGGIIGNNHNHNNVNGILTNGNNCTTTLNGSTIMNGIGSTITTTTSSSSLSSSSSSSSSCINGNILVAATEDSSQSSLNLSSSGYLSGSSVNSSIGGGGSGSNLNLNTSMGQSIGGGGGGGIVLPLNNSLNNDHQLTQQTVQHQQQSTGGRRRTSSTNSNGNQRSPCILRAGTREVHNKLEKHRRAHLKECFEQLKVQLQLKDEEKKKTSNLAILGAAYRHVILLRRKERELEQQVEQLAKEKINAQKKIVSLKRELSAKYDNIDFSTIISDGDCGSIPNERVAEIPCDTVSSLSSGRGSVRYSSSSSLSSGTTISSPLGAGMTSGLTLAISPVISSTSSNTSPNSLNMKITSPMIINPVPLSSLTALKTNFGNNTIMMTAARSSSTTPSPSSPSSSGISSSSPIISSASSSPPSIGGGGGGCIKIPNGIKLPIVTAATAGTTSSSILNNIKIENGIMIPTTTIHTTNNGGGIGIPVNFNSTQNNVQISHNFNNLVDIINNNHNTPKDLAGKNGINRKNPLTSDNNNREIITNSSSRVILTNGGSINNNNNIHHTHNNFMAKEIKLEESEHPTKVIKLINGGVALAPIDKDNKIQMTSTPISLSQVVGGGGLVVSPFSMLSSQALRVIGPNGLATIELTTPQMQSQSRGHTNVSTPTMTSVTSSNGGGAQLHKLLVNGGGGTTITGTSSMAGSGNNNNNNNNNNINMSNNCNPTFTAHINGNTVASELARLPGGAELNILPNNTNGGSHSLHRGYGKLAIVNNNGITSLKSTTSDSINNCGRALHVVTPIQTGNSPISGLTPIVVSQQHQQQQQQGQSGNNLAHIIATTSQLTGKVNLSVTGQTLISAQYLSSMKPVVVVATAAVTNHLNPTLSTVPQTSATTIYNCKYD